MKIYKVNGKNMNEAIRSRCIYKFMKRKGKKKLFLTITNNLKKKRKKKKQNQARK